MKIFFKKNENFVILIFFLILFLILFEGFLCRPLIGPSWYIPCHLDNPPLLCQYDFCKKSFFDNFWNENGFVENLQVLFLIFSIFFLIKAKNVYSENKLINYFLIIKIIAIIYYLGEEISWGQHYFKWSSSDWFVSNNNQKETNIHNITNLFDQLPRTLVIIWCTFVVPTVLFFEKYYDFNKYIYRILCPNKKLILFSLTLFFFIFPDLIVDKFALHPMIESSAQERAYFYDMITFNFLRLSELHEFIFCSYFLFYSLTISKNNEKF